MNGFAYADVFDGYFELVADADCDAAFCGAVQFGQCQRADFGGGGELFALFHSVLSGRSVQDEEDFVGCVGQFFFDASLYFRKFVHQVYFGVESSSRINNANIAVIFDCKIEIGRAHV